MTSSPRPPSRILIVDDEPNVRLTVSAILEMEGYSVDTAEDGSKGVEALEAQHYDLVLTDLKMPGTIDGLGVLRAVQERSPGTATVMMTGYATADTALEAIQLGAYDYLIKPTEILNLKRAVFRALESKRLSEVETLYRITSLLSTARSLDRICGLVSTAVRETLKIASASLVKVQLSAEDGRNGHPHLAEHSFLDQASVMARLAMGRSLTELDLPAIPRKGAPRSCVLIPGIANGQLVCVLYVHNRDEAYSFNPSVVRLLESIACQAAMSIENVLLIDALRSNNRELLAANNKLRELDTLKSQFLNVATHELRTPLTMIQGYNSMLAESLAGRLEPSELETLTDAARACKRLIRLVNSMLDISQIESGKMRMSFAPTDLRTLVNSVLTLFQQQAAHKKVHFSVEVPARLPKAEVDSERLEQVLVNLIGNALKFTPEGGNITVALRQTRDHRSFEISVTDNGPGILAKDHSAIFDEFVRVEGGEPQEGSGLGLAIAKRIVEAHHGTLDVRSEVGEGSTFTVRLPVSGQRAAARSAV